MSLESPFSNKKNSVLEVENSNNGKILENSNNGNGEKTKNIVDPDIYIKNIQEELENLNNLIRVLNNNYSSGVSGDDSINIFKNIANTINSIKDQNLLNKVIAKTNKELQKISYVYKIIEENGTYRVTSSNSEILTTKDKSLNSRLENRLENLKISNSETKNLEKVDEKI